MRERARAGGVGGLTKLAESSAACGGGVARASCQLPASVNGESGLALTNTHVTPLGRETAREDPDRHRCLVLNLGYARKHAHLVVVTSSAKPQDRSGVCAGERGSSLV